MRRIASATSGATESTRIFARCLSGVRGTELVMTTSSSTDSLMRLMAGPDSTPWTGAGRRGRRHPRLGGGGEDAPRPLAPEARPRRDQGSRGVDHVVDDPDVLAIDVADEVHEHGH